MEKNKGYQIIEPECLNELIQSNVPYGVKLFVIGGIISLVKQTTAYSELRGIELHAVRVDYLGNYPVIGIHYFSDNPLDLGRPIEIIVEEIVKSEAVSNIVSYIMTSFGD